MDVGERCGVFLLTGDLVECFGKILAWFASLLGQPDKLSKKNQGTTVNSNWAYYKTSLPVVNGSCRAVFYSFEIQTITSGKGNEWTGF